MISLGRHCQGDQVTLQEAVQSFVSFLAPFMKQTISHIECRHPDKVKLAVNETIEAVEARFVEITKAYKSCVCFNRCFYVLVQQI